MYRGLITFVSFSDFRRGLGQSGNPNGQVSVGHIFSIGIDSVGENCFIFELLCFKTMLNFPQSLLGYYNSFHPEQKISFIKIKKAKKLLLNFKKLNNLIIRVQIAKLNWASLAKINQFSIATNILMLLLFMNSVFRYRLILLEPSANHKLGSSKQPK